MCKVNPGGTEKIIEEPVNKIKKCIIQKFKNKLFSMKTYRTVAKAVNGLIQRGYSIDFTTEVDRDCRPGDRISVKLPSDDFQIDEIHRFVGNTDMGDEIIVFAISSREKYAKGIMVNAYGMCAERMPVSIA